MGQSVIEINKQNLISNIKRVKDYSQNELYMVVKANAYGHGLKQIVKIAEKYVDGFQIDDYIEYKEIKKYTHNKIFVACFCSNKELEEISRNGDFGCLISLDQIKNANFPIKAHLKLDCFLGRQGILNNKLESVINIIKNKNIKIEGAYTHLSDVEDPIHTQKQINQFRKAVKKLKNELNYSFKTHINGSLGLLSSKTKVLNTDISRVGKLVYGFCDSLILEVKPVLSWRSFICQIKEVPPNYPIGYGKTYVTKKRTRIGIVPQGYSDGVDRRLSNKGFVIVHGHKCKILGVISMNMLVIDLSKLKKCKSGDKVTIIGRDSKAKITAKEVANLIGTINYEVLSRISPKIPRKIV